MCTQDWWHEAVIHVHTASIFTHTHLLDIAHHSNAAAYADGYKKCVMITKMALRVRQTNWLSEWVTSWLTDWETRGWLCWLGVPSIYPFLCYVRRRRAHRHARRHEQRRRLAIATPCVTHPAMQTCTYSSMIMMMLDFFWLFAQSAQAQQ